MEMSDKAVSTEEFSNDFDANQTFEIARLEAVLSTLVCNKVDAIKHEKRSSSLNSSPKTIIQRLRISSTSTTSSKHKENASNPPRNLHKWRKISEEDSYDRPSSKLGPDVSISSPESQRIRPKSSLKRTLNQTPTSSDVDPNEVCQFENNYKTRICPAELPQKYYSKKDNRKIRMHFDDDYISLKIDEYDDIEDQLFAQEELRRARRKRRRKRKRRIKRQMALNHITILPPDEKIKVLDPNELPPRARWTIVATACLLLFMCLLLVGITLRMAPLIDDMVRKENEQLMNSLNREPANHWNKT